MTGLIADPVCCQHNTGENHPETAARFEVVVGALEDSGLVDELQLLPSRDATIEELRFCHSSDYLSLAQYDIMEGETVLFSGDTNISEGSWRAALRACGGVLCAVDAVLEGRVQNVFCVVRPPGHHATESRGMGFCIVNHVAVAARYAQRRWGIGNVLIVDWDVHHGNGTQDIFYDDGTVFNFSTHQAPLYPGTGREGEIVVGSGVGTTLNCPIPAGAGRAEVIAAFKANLLPAMASFRPEFILVSAGFDSHFRDPLGDLRLHDQDFADLTKLVADLAAQYSGGKLVSVLEGGYHLESLATATVAHVRSLIAAGWSCLGRAAN